MEDLKPLIAVLGLIAVAVVAALATYYLTLAHLSHPIKVEKFVADSVYVRNVGAEPITIYEVYLLDGGEVVCRKKLGVELEPGALAVITLNSTGYTVKIVTNRGAITAKKPARARVDRIHETTGGAHKVY